MLGQSRGMLGAIEGALDVRVSCQQTSRRTDHGEHRQPMPTLCKLPWKQPDRFLIAQDVQGQEERRDIALRRRGTGKLQRRGRVRSRIGRRWIILSMDARSNKERQSVHKKYDTPWKSHLQKPWGPITLPRLFQSQDVECRRICSANAPAITAYPKSFGWISGPKGGGAFIHVQFNSR